MGHFDHGFYALDTVVAADLTAATDLLGAMKLIFDASDEARAAAPGGWFTDDGAISTAYPYVTVRQKGGQIGLRTSDSNVDNVQVRLRVWGTKYPESVRAADALEDLFLGSPPIAWAGGWATVLERVDRVSSTPGGRAPANQGVLRMVDIVLLTHVRRGIHA
jgi:hypothetical protein